MSFFFNGTKISVGKKQELDDADVTEIKYNGETVWKYDVDPHPIPPGDSTTVKRTGGSYSFDAYYGYWDYRSAPSSDWPSSNREGPYYYNNYAYIAGTVWASWYGACIIVSVTYYGEIDLTQIPNYEEIKRVVIDRYGYGSYTVNVTPGMTKIGVSDYKESRNSVHTKGYSVWTGATAGIRSVSYYFV